MTVQDNANEKVLHVQVKKYVKPNSEKRTEKTCYNSIHRSSIAMENLYFV